VLVRNEFLDAIDDLGVGRGNLFRTSRGGSTGAFQTGLENILLSPEERAIAEQEYADAQAAKKKDDRDAFYGKDADSTGKITSGKNKGKFSQSYIDQQKRLATKTEDGFLADLQAAGTDLASRPGRLMDDLSDLGSSVSQGFSDLTSGISDLFTGGRDDTPSAPPTQFSDANLNAMSDALGMEAFDALSGDERVTPFSDPMYGEQGRGFFPPDTEITQSDLPPAGTAYDAGEFVGVSPRLEYMDDDEGFDSAVYVPPSVATNLGISLGGDTADRSGVLPSSDLGRLLSGDPQVVDDVIKLLAVDPDRTKRDLLSTATTTFGPYGPSISGIGDAPVIDRMGYYDGGDERILGYDLDYENQLRDRDLDVLRRDLDVLRGDQVDLSGLPANIQGLPPSDLQAQRELDVLRGSQAPDPEMDALSLLQQFRDAQPEGALKGGAFDFVPDPQQLQNFAQDSNLSSSLDNILRNIDFTSYIPPASQGDVQPKPLDALGNLIENIGGRDLPSFLQPDGGKGFDDPVTIGEAISNLNPFGAAEANPAVASAALKFTKNIVNDNLGKAAAVTGGALATVPLMQRVDEFIRESLGISDAAIGTIPENQKLEFTANQTGVPLAELNATIQNEAMSENPNINISGSIAPSISALQGLTAPNVDTSLPTVGLSAASIPYDAGEFAMPVDRSGNPYAVFDPATGIAIPYSSADAAQGANILAGDNLGVGTGDALSALEAELGTTDESDRFATATGATIGRTGDEAKDLSAISSITNLDNVLDIGANTGVNTQPVVEANVIDAAIADLTGDDTTLPPPPPPVDVDEDPVVVSPPAEEDPVVVESDPPISVPPSGDSDTPKSKQERRDYSRMREILEQRPRRIGGTAPGLGYKPVEGISNTLNKAADNFLDALRFG
jgi:hypothetical protein